MPPIGLNLVLVGQVTFFLKKKAFLSALTSSEMENCMHEKCLEYEVREVCNACMTFSELYRKMWLELREW